MNRFELKPKWLFVCRDKYGLLQWSEEFTNLVVNDGKALALSRVFFTGITDISYYLGLTGPSPTPGISDLMTGHAGWTEVVDYSESTRVSYVHGNQASSQLITNSASPARFTISQDATSIGGGFLVSDNTKGGTAGTLMSVGALGSGNRTLNTLGTLDLIIQYQF